MGQMRSLSWNLDDANLGALEKAGLAGLYMTLDAAERSEEDLAPLSFHLENRAVCLSWEGEDQSTLLPLVRLSWQAPDGVLFLPGVHREAIQHSRSEYRLAVHNGILGTFFQHNRVQPRSKDVTRTVLPVDENLSVRYTYKRLKSDRDLKPIQDFTERFFSGKELKTTPVSLSSWVFPGSAGRYKTEKAWTGPVEIAFLLLFAPVACLYRRFQNNWVLVIPNVQDLEEYADVRPGLDLDPRGAVVAGLGDAGLRFAAEYASRAVRKEIPVGCQVVAMGPVGYYQSQRVRKGVLRVRPTLRSVSRYQRTLAAFASTCVMPAENAEDADADGGWIRVPSVRGRIAANIVESLPWYRDLAYPPPWEREALESQRKRHKQSGRDVASSAERLWFGNLRRYNREGLMELANQQDMWDSDEERSLVEAVHQSLAALYAREAEAARRGGARSPQERWEDLNEEIRRGLMRAKTRDLLRAYLADFFARAGRRKCVQEHAAALWSLINHPQHWKKARDLALLALVSYAGKGREEEEEK